MPAGVVIRMRIDHARIYPRLVSYSDCKPELFDLPNQNGCMVLPRIQYPPILPLRPRQRLVGDFWGNILYWTFHNFSHRYVNMKILSIISIQTSPRQSIEWRVPLAQLLQGKTEVFTIILVGDLRRRNLSRGKEVIPKFRIMDWIPVPASPIVIFVQRTKRTVNLSR